MMLTELIRNWYQGKRIYPENDPNSSVVFFFTWIRRTTTYGESIEVDY